MDATKLLLLKSWSKVCEDLPGFTHRFYDRLFADYPTLRTAFRQIDTRAQDRHVQSYLGAIAMGRLSTAHLVVLGRRYAGHGIQSVHYGSIMQSLLWALEQQLGSAWTLAARNAWDDALTQAAAVMAAGERRRRHYQFTGENVLLFLTFR